MGSIPQEGEEESSGEEEEGNSEKGNSLPPTCSCSFSFSSAHSCRFGLGRISAHPISGSFSSSGKDSTGT